MLDKNISVDTLDKQITVEETSYVQTNLKNGKSPGPDTILNEFLKYGKNVFTEPLTELFNLILKTQVYPKNWCAL